MASIPESAWHSRGEWQDISTAPRGGVSSGPFGESGPTILLSDGSAVPYIGFWNGRSWDDGDFQNDMGGMTHWMPLPAPPTPKDTP